MTFIICEPCIETKDTACVDACPVDCIHPRADEADFDPETQLYIDPEECIDCGACVPACPVTAIYDSVEAVPESQAMFIEANEVYRLGEPEAMEQAEDIVKAHMESRSDLLAVAPIERQRSH